MLAAFCEKHAIRIEKCGKLIVATSTEEISRLDELERRGIANGVPGLKRLRSEEIQEIEPHAAGLEALYSPETAIIDFIEVAKAYARSIRKQGGEIFLNQKVENILTHSPLEIVTEKETFLADRLINCAGCFADRIAHHTDSSISPKQIIPFRGEYYEVIPSKQFLVKGLIYPVPDPAFPFLGVHLSKTIHGRVEAGPNAVLALAREGYSKMSLSFHDCKDMLSYEGFWKMARKYWKTGLYEIVRSFSKHLFLKSLQKLVPSLQLSDIKSSIAGVRAQVILQDGSLHDDFLIIEKGPCLHVLSAPSPAATSSLSIGESLATKILA